MKAIRFLSFLLLLLCFTSCATTALQSKVQRLSLGMPKADVVRVLGNNYQILHSMLTPEGDAVEILKYTDSITDEKYEVEITNGILVRFTKLHDRPEHSHNHKHHHPK